MKIYTKTGDDGTTSLFGGKRTRKDDIRVSTYGDVDELNSLLGVTISFVGSHEIKSDLMFIQNLLFNVGAYLATPEEDKAKLKDIREINDDDVKFLEERIDYYDAKLPELKNFILPGGKTSAGFLHYSRTVCRRCERNIVHLALETKNKQIYIKFFNRLSDYLFITARYENYFSGNEEIEWKK